jgi:SAM-dependent methyltransferase
MNRLKNKFVAVQHDDHRPLKEFWGPAQVQEMTVQPDITFQFNNIQTKPERCLICSFTNTTFLVNVYGWPVYECSRCGVGFVWPQPSEELLRNFYSAGYWSNYMGSEDPLYHRSDLTSHIFMRQGQCFDRIMKNNREGRILDIGAGDGTMLRILTDMGYRNVCGIDLDEDNARRAREHLKVNVHACEFLSFSEKGWDAITLWAVIEHLREPVMYLRHARSLLKPGGLFILMTGDNASAQAWVQGALDMWVYPPEHLFFFTRKSLQALFHESGFIDFKCRLQFQSVWKESLLWGVRMAGAIKTRLDPRLAPWRSLNSNLLVAWGRTKV